MSSRAKGSSAALVGTEMAPSYDYDRFVKVATLEGQIMKVMIKSAWGSDESTKAAFAFLHANAFAAAGQEVQIFLLGEAVSLMRNETMNSVTPVGWPSLSEIMRETIGHKIPLNI